MKLTNKHDPQELWDQFKQQHSKNPQDKLSTSPAITARYDNPKADFMAEAVEELSPILDNLLQDTICQCLQEDKDYVSNLSALIISTILSDTSFENYVDSRVKVVYPKGKLLDPEEISAKVKARTFKK